MDQWLLDYLDEQFREAAGKIEGLREENAQQLAALREEINQRTAGLRSEMMQRLERLEYNIRHGRFELEELRNENYEITHLVSFLDKRLTNFSEHFTTRIDGVRDSASDIRSSISVMESRKIRDSMEAVCQRLSKPPDRPPS